MPKNNNASISINISALSERVTLSIICIKLWIKSDISCHYSNSNVIKRIKKYILHLVVTLIPMMIFSQEIIHKNNKILPGNLKNEILKALSYYPELKEVAIEFKIQPSLNKSFMKAQPKLSSFFRSKKNRKYVILISNSFSLDELVLKIEDIPSEVLIGWFGHELGHIIDYQQRSSINLVWYGIRYLLSQNYIREAEKAADVYALTHNMQHYILQTKRFILDNAGLPQKYKDRIRRLYLSPDEILLLTKEFEQN